MWHFSLGAQSYAYAEIIEATNGLRFPTGFPIQSTALEALFCGAGGLATPMPPQIYPYFSHGLLLGCILAWHKPPCQNGWGPDGGGGVSTMLAGESEQVPSGSQKIQRKSGSSRGM